MKRGFTFLIVLFALMSYFQVTTRMQTNELFSTAIVHPVTQPFVTIINKQLTTQIRNQLLQVPQIGVFLNTASFTRLAVDQVVNTLTDSGKKDFFGLPGSAIDSKKITVSPEGDVDVGPLVDSLIPQIFSQTLEKFSFITWLLPAIITLVIILFLQPLLFLFELFLYLPTFVIFKLLVATGFAHLEKETVEREKLVI